VSALQRQAFAANVGRRASFRDMWAPLRDEFARELLVRKFGEAASSLILSAFGQVSKGKRQGEQRGHLHWVKCEAGGWSGTGVMYPGSQNYRVTFNGAPGIGCILERAAYTGNDDEYITYVNRMFSKLLPKARVRALSHIGGAP
jgi:hypothetical protein